jgi:alpha-N-arabinofuranosidase
MDGLSLHYYTLPTGDWGDKGHATEFGEEEWHATLRRTLEMDSLIARHSAIMDKHDEDKRVGLIVDEWGTWYNAEPGRNPGFLYQQNTLRDALVAALNFHVFHRHADRVHMANIAQTVNVLQAVILTEGERMILTPTYHTFEMFKVHQGGTVVPADLESPEYVRDGEAIPVVSVSASKPPGAAAGPMHLSLVNTHANRPCLLRCTLGGSEVTSATGRILTAAELTAHNTFDAPQIVQPASFDEARIEGDVLEVPLPARSVVMLTLR